MIPHEALAELRRRGHEVWVSYPDGGTWPPPQLEVSLVEGRPLSGELRSYLKQHKQLLIEALHQEAWHEYDLKVEEAMQRAEEALDGVPAGARR